MARLQLYSLNEISRAQVGALLQCTRRKLVGSYATSDVTRHPLQIYSRQHYCNTPPCPALTSCSLSTLTISPTELDIYKDILLSTK